LRGGSERQSVPCGTADSTPWKGTKCFKERQIVRHRKAESALWKGRESHGKAESNPWKVRECLWKGRECPKERQRVTHGKAESAVWTGNLTSSYADPAMDSRPFIQHSLIWQPGLEALQRSGQRQKAKAEGKSGNQRQKAKGEGKGRRQRQKKINDEAPCLIGKGTS